MMYRVCLVYVNYVCLLKNVCNFKSIKINEIQKKISLSVSFHQNFQVFHTKLNIRFRRLVLLEMNCFEKIFKRVLQMFSLQCK